MSSIFLQGNARDVLKGLPADFFHCCVTSPPYFGLRKYDGGEEIWDEGAGADCEHEWGVVAPPRRSRKASDIVNLSSKEATNKGNLGIELTSTSFCSKCNAWRGQLGAEPTPELYIRHLIQIMREVRRVLRPDSVFFVNIGDSWSGSGGAHKPEHANPGISKSASRSGVPLAGVNYNGCKPLDMVLIPEQLALAARADGWYVRSVLIWAKGVSCSDEFNGNPMPESVNGWRWERHKVKVAKSARADQDSYHSLAFGDSPMGKRDGREFADHSKEWQDCPGCPKCEKHDGYILRKGSWRPTDSYEHILMLTKTSSYFCDREAVLEPVQQSSIDREKYGWNGAFKGRYVTPNPNEHRVQCDDQFYTSSGGRNLRSVLMIPTVGYKGAHFAVFPPRLVEPLVKSATSERGCCPVCGSPWARVIDKHKVPRNELSPEDPRYRPNRYFDNKYANELRDGFECGMYSETSTVGWLSTCDCSIQDTEPCRVLDPFSGAGTTSLVCERLGLDSVGIDTSEKYIKLAKERLAKDEQKRIAEFVKSAKRLAKGR